MEYFISQSDHELVGNSGHRNILRSTFAIIYAHCALRSSTEAHSSVLRAWLWILQRTGNEFRAQPLLGTIQEQQDALLCLSWGAPLYAMAVLVPVQS